MGRHSRPDPPPSRRSLEPSPHSAPQGRRRRAVDEDHPSGPLPQVSGYHEPITSPPDDLSDLEAPTRRNQSGEDISGLAGADATESGYFGGAGYFSDFGGYTDIGDSRDDSDVRVLAGLGYDLGNPDVESLDSAGGIEELEAPTTKTSPDDLDVPTTKTSGTAELEAPTTKTSFGMKRRRRREPEPDVPEDLDAPTRKHSPGPKRRRAEPTEDELRQKRRRSTEKAGRRAAPAESAPTAEASGDATEGAPDDSAVPSTTSSRAERAASAERSGAKKRPTRPRPGPWSKHAGSARTEASAEAKSRTESPAESESRSAAQPSETGYHRAVGTSRRGIAKWPVAVAAVLALLALGGLGAVWANKTLNAQAEAEANSCTEGNRTLRVTTTPTIEDAVTTAATKWNADKPPVYSHCATVEVTAKASDKVLPTLRKTKATAVPAVWITPSAEWAEKLAKTNPERVSSTAEPLKNANGTYYTYVVVGGSGVDEIQQRAAQKFRDYVREVLAQ
ncbi:hypothetical protein [Haloechinothrix halophila]|uniref:hypothetical protein n=1 Tax=Haloechinothrix halophila TaxID=1069073 RepID=UPI0003F50701|nr:hypothetical protein [Haloechinothrix halophila]